MDPKKVQENKSHEYFFKNEKPITNISQDKKGLNRANFAENLANNIENYFKYNTDCLTIGLMGEWGSGKTSIINLTKHYLNNEIKIIEFNPWIYSSYNQLIEQFFEELIGQFSDDKRLIKNLKSYWFKLNKTNLAKSILPILVSTKSKTTGDIIEKTFNVDSQELSLKKIKDKINNELKNHKIICIIDDLDRISNDGINDIFKLIKIMADFDNIIYILSFDKNLISKSLDGNFNDGRKYLEKIINIPLDVPLATESELKNILSNYLKMLSEEHEIEFDEDRLNSILDDWDYESKKDYGILYFFKNIRDIKRFINILEFNIELVKNEVNFVDFISITAIQLFKPNIYEKIKYKEYLLVKYSISKQEYSSNTNIVKIEQEEFEKLTGEDYNLKYILQTLFPKMKFIYNTRSLSDYDEYYDAKLAICHPNHFKTYFKLNPNIKKITQEEISLIINFINSENELETFEQMRTFNELNKLDLFFKSLKSNIDSVDKHEFCLKVIFSINKKLSEEIFDNNRFILKKICLLLVMKINSENRFETIKNEYNNMNNLMFLYELVIHIEKHNYIPYMKDEIILTENELNELKFIIKCKYKQLNADYFKHVTNLSQILDMGMDLGLKNEVENIVNTLISTNDGLICFLKSFMYPDMDNFLDSEIRNISYYADMDIIKEKIDENYDKINDIFEIKKFLKEYEIWKSSY